MSSLFSRRVLASASPWYSPCSIFAPRSRSRSPPPPARPATGGSRSGPSGPAPAPRRLRGRPRHCGGGRDSRDYRSKRRNPPGPAPAAGGLLAAERRPPLAAALQRRPHAGPRLLRARTQLRAPAALRSCAARDNAPRAAARVLPSSRLSGGVVVRVGGNSICRKGRRMATPAKNPKLDEKHEKLIRALLKVLDWGRCASNISLSLSLSLSLFPRKAAPPRTLAPPSEDGVAYLDVVLSSRCSFFASFGPSSAAAGQQALHGLRGAGAVLRVPHLLDLHLHQLQRSAVRCCCYCCWFVVVCLLPHLLDLHLHACSLTPSVSPLHPAPPFSRSLSSQPRFGQPRQERVYGQLHARGSPRPGDGRQPGAFLLLFFCFSPPFIIGNAID